ncbi:hypothetical protein QCA50_020283 [Cerrena zonata]|uniref:Uncharacterized protein n=1 Tax=Cerrena zonata TaxID=2478898 RepID=A0AAW0FCX2_9APHY
MPPKRIEPGSRTKFYGLSQHKNAYHQHTRTPMQYPPNPASETPHTPSNSLSPSPDVDVQNSTPPHLENL